MVTIRVIRPCVDKRLVNGQGQIKAGGVEKFRGIAFRSLNGQCTWHIVDLYTAVCCQARRPFCNANFIAAKLCQQISATNEKILLRDFRQDAAAELVRILVGERVEASLWWQRVPRAQRASDDVIGRCSISGATLFLLPICFGCEPARFSGCCKCQSRC